MTIADLVARHRVIGIDSNVPIYLFDGTPPLADAAQLVLEAVERGDVAGVLATVGLTEVLSRPAALGDGALFERYARELTSIPNLRVIPLAAETAIDAAWGRSGGRDLGDAIHVATARSAGATAFITNDRRVRGRSGVEVVLLSDLRP